MKKFKEYFTIAMVFFLGLLYVTIGQIVKSGSETPISKFNITIFGIFVHPMVFVFIAVFSILCVIALVDILKEFKIVHKNKVNRYHGYKVRMSFSKFVIIENEKTRKTKAEKKLAKLSKETKQLISSVAILDDIIYDSSEGLRILKKLYETIEEARESMEQYSSFLMKQEAANEEIKDLKRQIRKLSYSDQMELIEEHFDYKQMVKFRSILERLKDLL